MKQKKCTCIEIHAYAKLIYEISYSFVEVIAQPINTFLNKCKYYPLAKYQAVSSWVEQFLCVKQQTVCDCEVVYSVNWTLHMQCPLYCIRTCSSAVNCNVWVYDGRVVLQFLETNSEYLHPFSMFPAFQVRKRCENLWFYNI